MAWPSIAWVSTYSMPFNRLGMCWSFSQPSAHLVTRNVLSSVSYRISGDKSQMVCYSDRNDLLGLPHQSNLYGDYSISPIKSPTTEMLVFLLDLETELSGIFSHFVRRDRVSRIAARCRCAFLMQRTACGLATVASLRVHRAGVITPVASLPFNAD